MRANVGLKVRAAKLIRADADELCDVPCFKLDLVRRLRKSMPGEDELSSLAVLFGVLADRTRLRILHALSDAEELCVCDVAHVLGVSVSAASFHLRKLRDLGVLKHRNDGKMAYYRIARPLAAKLLAQALRAGGSAR